VYSLKNWLLSTTSSALKKSIFVLFKKFRLFSFNKILLFIKKLAFDGFYPLLVVLKKSILLLFKNDYFRDIMSPYFEFQKFNSCCRLIHLGGG